MTPRLPDVQGSLAGLPRNFLRPCLLLLLHAGACHGYELMERLPGLGFPRPDAGGLYRTLRAMEREGFVHSWWETSDAGPARRTYELTDEGVDWLHAWAGVIREAQRTMDRFLSGYEDALGEGPSARSRPTRDLNGDRS